MRVNRAVLGGEAFQAPDDSSVVHHLYVCSVDTPNLHNHLLLRDYLRLHPELVREYSDLKQQLAARYANNIDTYVAGKTAFIEAALAKAQKEYGFDKFQPSD